MGTFFRPFDDLTFTTFVFPIFTYSTSFIWLIQMFSASKQIVLSTICEKWHVCTVMVFISFNKGLKIVKGETYFHTAWAKQMFSVYYYLIVVQSWIKLSTPTYMYAHIQARARHTIHLVEKCRLGLNYTFAECIFDSILNAGEKAFIPNIYTYIYWDLRRFFFVDHFYKNCIIFRKWTIFESVTIQYIKS